VTAWLSLVGIGEDGLEGLSPEAQNRLARATLVVGGARHLALAAPLSTPTLRWPSPIEDAIPALLARRGEPTCVLASGDPFWFGVGALLRRHFAPEEIFCLPAPSAFSLAAARLGWSLQDCAMLSLHGRALAAIIPHLQPSAKILALSWDGATPRALARALVERGMGRSIVTVCEAMGGANERLRTCLAERFEMTDVADLNTIALEVVAGRGSRVLPHSPGLPDEYFEHDGQITKRETRALTLSALAPRRGELLWDIGAGSGSIAIEWMHADPANRAIAIEQRPERAARIGRNALNLGVPGLRVVEGRAPEALQDLPQPQAIFGGGGSAPGALEFYLAALAPGGRLVVNAVTLETQAELTAAYKRWGGDLIQASFAHTDAVGRFTGWRAAMPLVQWRIEKPWPA
jgi:precorrin-6B C5,15-methyltransferase / cobalt-precorrin-6B C5,C15-methyltransferase